MSSKLFIIACEPSGDAHGASLIEELKKIHPQLEVEGLGGPKMEKAGAKLIYDMTTISALGLGDVLRQYFKYLSIFNRALDRVKTFKPNAIVAIDSPAFNLRFAKKIKKQIPFIYYISPQLWAWGHRRIHVVKKFVTKMLVILPFEKTMYDQAGIDCEFVGHPLLDHLPKELSKDLLRKELSQKSLLPLGEKARMGGLTDPHPNPLPKGEGIIIGLLPGSRKKEVERIFPLMLETARHLKALTPQVVFVTKPSPNVPPETFDTILKNFPDLKVYASSLSMHEVVAGLDFALITSGTATLETALIGTPFFLFYKASWSTYFLGKYLVRVPFLGLANLLANKRVVPEFIQEDIRPEKIAEEAKRYLEDSKLCDAMKKDFLEIKKMLGQSGASRHAAQAVSSFLK